MTWTRSNSGIDSRGRLTLGRAAVLCAVLAGLSGCISETAPKPDQNAAAVPQSAPRTVGAQHAGGGEERNLIAAFGGTYADTKAETLLDGVATRLVAASTEPGIS